MNGLGMSNNGTGLVLASLSLGGYPKVMLPIILYNLVQHVVAALVQFLKFRGRTGEPGQFWRMNQRSERPVLLPIEVSTSPERCRFLSCTTTIL